MSDIKNEIPDIELVLFILEKEQEQGINGFYMISHNLQDLIVHLRKIKELMFKKKNGVLSEEEIKNIKEYNISLIAENVIMANI